MKITVDEKGETTVFHLNGDIDLECSVEIREILLTRIEQSAALVVNFESVGLIDSSGIASLLDAYQTARERGVKFVLAGVGPSVLRVMKLARLETIFPMVDSVADGLAPQA